MEDKIQYECPKCGGNDYETDRMRATGGGFAKIFDVQNKKFTTVTCTNCGYTELYRGKTSSLGNIFDFFTN
ncbi:MAG: zinc ribbon domain-containing protein [Candidatus Marinimicrobia bacterium]|nr:zinc ribbon domain-containing protein [Candidatus Neomarinimicrobiota bacterium]